MNKKGFTLIEVILVIAIIAVLSLILVPNVLVLIDKNNEKSCNSLRNNIISAAKIYVNDNKYNLNFNCNISKQIPLQDLIDSGDLTDNPVNPITKKDLDKTTVVEVTYDCTSKTFTYDYKLDCNNK